MSEKLGSRAGRPTLVIRLMVECAGPDDAWRDAAALSQAVAGFGSVQADRVKPYWKFDGWFEISLRLYAEGDEVFSEVVDCLLPRYFRCADSVVWDIRLDGPFKIGSLAERARWAEIIDMVGDAT